MTEKATRHPITLAERGEILRLERRSAPGAEPCICSYENICVVHSEARGRHSAKARRALRGYEDSLREAEEELQRLREKRVTEHFANHCSFCGESALDLVIGPEVSICFSCVDIARDYVGRDRIRARQGRDKLNTQDRFDWEKEL